MPQKPIIRKTPIAKPTPRKNTPKPEKIRNPIVAALAKKQHAITLKKIENTVASKTGAEAASLSVIKIDKQLVGRLHQANNKKKV